MTATPEAIAASGVFMQVAERLSPLWKLDDQMTAVLTLLDLPEDEAGDELDTDALAQRRDELAGALLQKVENYGSVIRTLEKIAEGRKGEADRMRARAKRAESGADWLKSRLLEHMQQTGQTRIETPRFTFSIRQNPPSVVVLEEMLIPKEFKRTVVTTTVDKVAIKQHLHATGELVPGVAVVRDERISIS